MKKQILAALSLLPVASFALSAGNVVTDSLGVDKAVATSPAALLRGEVSGVRVSSIDGSSNGALNVNVRGLNTIHGDSQPLWIIDGVVLGNRNTSNLDAFFQKGGQTTQGADIPDYSGQSYTSPVNDFGWLNPYDIESIEVIKDMSAAAIYGMQGANGVIIITTNRPKEGEHHIKWDSNMSVNIPTVTGELYRPSISHNHSVGVSGATANNTSYNASAYFRNNNGTAKGINSTNAGIAVNFDTQANRIFWFGLNSFLAMGKGSSTAGGTYIGSPSTTMIARYPNAFSDTLDGWLDDYDDDLENYRTVNSAYLRINFMPGLYFKATGGLDYQNDTRTIWYGEGTSFGKAFSGAAAVLNNSLLNYNINTELRFDRYFSEEDHFQAGIGVDFNGYDNKYNTMSGTSFELPYLRGLGLSASSSRNPIHKYSRNYAETGFWGQVKYDHNGAYGANATLRADVNRTYTKSGAQLFPAVDAYVDIAKAWLDSDVISTMKLSAGYGIAGREYAMPYDVLGYYINNVTDAPTEATNYYEGLNRLISGEYNVGIDFGFAEDRYMISAKVYDKSTDDIFSVYNFGKHVNQQWEPTNNWTIEENRTTTIKNSGVEIDAKLGVIKDSDIEWSVWSNFAYNHNEVKSICGYDLYSYNFNVDTYVATNVAGQSVASISGAKFGSNGEIVDMYTVIGNSLPKFTGALGTTFRWQNLTLDAKFNGVGGFSIVNANKLVEAKRNYFTENDLEAGDYLRLETLAASYEFPFNTKWIKGLRVNLAAHNLFTITRYSGYNPDVNSYGVTVRGNGIDYGSFPLNRSVVLGVSLKF